MMYQWSSLDLGNGFSFIPYQVTVNSPPTHPPPTPPTHPQTQPHPPTPKPNPNPHPHPHPQPHPQPLDKMAAKVCSEGSNCQRAIIGLANGLAPNRRQAIIWSNADRIHWRIYAAQGGDELINTHAKYATEICFIEILIIP